MPTHLRDQAEAMCRTTRARVGSAQIGLLRRVPEWEQAEVWDADGCRDLAEWLAGQLGVTCWFASRVIAAAHAICSLPGTALALESGALSLDKVVELTRFLTPVDEERWLRWARRRSAATIRARADAMVSVDPEPARDIERSRFLRFSWGEHSLYLEAAFGLDQGKVVVDALDRLAKKIPTVVGLHDDLAMDHDESLDKRRADALYALCAADAAAGDVERTTLVVHADIAALGSNELGAEMVGGHLIDADLRRRLTCDCRLEVVGHGRFGEALGIGRASRVVPAWLLRLVRSRDGDRCTFPGCKAVTWLEAHHIGTGSGEAGRISTTSRSCAASTTSSCTTITGRSSWGCPG